MAKLDAPSPATRNDAYTGLLVISFLALVFGCVLLYMEYSSYDGKTPPKGAPLDLPGSSLGKTSAPPKPVEAPKKEDAPKEEGAPKEGTTRLPIPEAPAILPVSFEQPASLDIPADLPPVPPIG